MLGALLGAAISAAVVLALSGDRPNEIDWSAWRPSSGGANGAQQIADHVAPLYRLSSGDQLVGVVRGDLEQPGGGAGGLRDRAHGRKSGHRCEGLGLWLLDRLGLSAPTAARASP